VCVLVVVVVEAGGGGEENVDGQVGWGRSSLYYCIKVCEEIVGSRGNLDSHDVPKVLCKASKETMVSFCLLEEHF
jgi:hypothetical protein